MARASGCLPECYEFESRHPRLWSRKCLKPSPPQGEDCAFLVLSGLPSVSRRALGLKALVCKTDIVSSNLTLDSNRVGVSPNG